jgi:integrase/recombinase XerD
VIRLQLADLGPATVLAFPDYLETERHNCAATRNCRLTAIHRFFAYVAGQDPRHAEPCRRVLDIPMPRFGAPQGRWPPSGSGWRGCLG